jgi:hypothetical protein
MPCHEPYSPNRDKEIYLKEFRHNSDVAEMLCYLIKWLEANIVCNPDRGFNSLLESVFKRDEEFKQKIIKWWEEHKERGDAKVS